MKKRDKKDNSRFKTVNIFKILPASKRSQSVFGMSFGTIFSILLIIFFIIIAFIAIRHFLNLRDCAKIGLFVDDFQEKIDKAWSSQKSGFSFTGSLPSNLDYVCFANFSRPINGNDVERKIGNEISVYKFSEGNMFFYPRENSCNMPYIRIKHINIEEITKIRNPYCIKIESGKIIVEIEKDYNDALVSIK
jgi:hypothetical protein